MADPTAGNRAALGKVIDAITPDEAPFKVAAREAALLEEQKAKDLMAQAEEEKKAAALSEIQAEGGQAAIPLAEGLSTSIPATAPVSPAAPALDAERAPATAAPAAPGLATSVGEQGLAMEANALSQAEKDKSLATEATRKAIADQELKTQADIDARRAQIDAKIKEIDDTKIERKSMWEGKSTGQKVAAAIGMFFAALSPQTAQSAISMINKQIDDDMKLQEGNLEKKRNTLSLLERQLGDRDAARAAFRVKALQDLELQVREVESKNKVGAIQGKRMQATEALRMEKEKAQTNLALAIGKAQEKNRGEMVDIFGFKGRAPSEKEAIEFRSAASDAIEAKKGVKRLMDISKMNGASFDPSLVAEANSIASSIMGKLRTTILGPGAISEPEWAILKSVVANPTRFFSLQSSNRVALSALEKKINSEMGTKARALGLMDSAAMVPGIKRIQ